MDDGAHIWRDGGRGGLVPDPASASPRVAIITLGTRGDVEPYLALSQALQARGAAVTLAASKEFSDLAAQRDVTFLPIDVNVLDPELAKATWGRQGSSHRVRRSPRLGPVRKWYAENAEAMIDGAQGAIEGADIAVGGGFLFTAVVDLALRAGMPAVTASMQPLLPTAEMASWAVTTRNMGPANKATWDIALRVTARLMRGIGKEVATRHGSRGPLNYSQIMRQLTDPNVLQLNAWSRTLLPQPSDYPANAVQVGFMNTTPAAGLSRAVKDFLAAGEPPVFATLGSMIHVDAQWFARTAIAAARAQGKRLLLSRGSLDPSTVGISAGSDDVLLIGNEPYDLLFPQCAAVIHHAGAGTTQTSAVSGTPQVPIPVATDQVLWSSVAHRLGIASAPISVNQLTPQRLTVALGQALLDATLTHAQDIGRRMRLEPNPAETAASLILEHAHTS